MNETTTRREYKLAAGPITSYHNGVRREIIQIDGDGHREVFAVVSNDDAIDVLEAIRRAYQDGREDRGGGDAPLEPLMTTHQGAPVDARDNIPKG